MHTCYPRTWEGDVAVGVRILGVQGQPLLCSEFEANLTIRDLKERKKEKKTEQANNPSSKLYLCCDPSFTVMTHKGTWDWEVCGERKETRFLIFR